MTTASSPPRARVAALNDRCRLALDPSARILVTRTCLHRLAGDADGPGVALAQLRLLAVHAYVFTEAEERERDRGTLRLDGTEIRFRIDYYDRSLEWGSPDPANPAVTTRVLTIMTTRRATGRARYSPQPEEMPDEGRAR